LERREREKILERYWWPHRRAVEEAVEELIAGGRRVVHVGVHSFTPQLGGEVRNADMALLYDSRRKAEAGFCRRWLDALGGLEPGLRLRVNYPYLGRADGLTTGLRRKHGEGWYLGVELEMNQAVYGGAGWGRFQRQVAESLRGVLAGGGG
jgi:predicted N-formylglutamate amidohydrolase